MEERGLLCRSLTKDLKIAADEVHSGRNNAWRDTLLRGHKRTLLYKGFMFAGCQIKELISITVSWFSSHWGERLFTSLLTGYWKQEAVCFSNHSLLSPSKGLPGTRASLASCRWTQRGPAWSSWRTASWPCSSPCRPCPGYWRTLCTAAAGGPGCRRAPGRKQEVGGIKHYLFQNTTKNYFFLSTNLLIILLISHDCLLYFHHLFFGLWYLLESLQTLKVYIFKQIHQSQSVTWLLY